MTLQQRATTIIGLAVASWGCVFLIWQMLRALASVIGG